MGIAHISMGSVMGGGAPVYSMCTKSQTVNTTSTTAAATIIADDGDYLRVVAMSGSIAFAINKTAATEPRMVVPVGAACDIGPLKAGDTVQLIDFA